MTLASPRLPIRQVPTPLSVIPVDDVAQRLVAASAELRFLAEALEETRREAEVYERALGDEFDQEAFEFVALRLSRFLADLRAESNSEFQALLSVADGSARRRPVLAKWEPQSTSAPHPERSAPPIETSWQLALAPVNPPTNPVPERAAEAEVAAEVEVEVEVEVDHDLDLEVEFWNDVPVDSRRRHFLRVSRAVALQGAAVVLVLAAVLLRVG